MERNKKEESKRGEASDTLWEFKRDFVPLQKKIFPFPLLRGRG